MNTRKNIEGRAPFSRQEIIDEVKKAAVAFASHLSAFGPGNALELAAAYLGCELERYDLDGLTEEELRSIPIERHFLHRVAMDAYDYAYQVGAKGLDYQAQIDERLHEVAALLSGFPQTDFNGEPSPLNGSNPQKLREVFETFVARYKLDQESDLTITELALLASMGEAAVRTSLSKEGITTISRQKGHPGVVPHEQAVKWLMGRRGFVPSAKFSEEHEGQYKRELLASLLDKPEMSLPEFLQTAMKLRKATIHQISEQARVPEPWLEGVLSGNTSPSIDIAALKRLAEALDVPTVPFPSKAVEYLLTRQSDK